MKILIDMDDVLEELVQGWCDYLNEKYGTTTKPEDVTDWHVDYAFPTLTKDQVYGAEFDDHLWDYVGPTKGADEVLRKLQDEGHDLFVVTASNYVTLKAKLEKVLFRYYPYIDWHNVIITHHKTMISGDVLIDDGFHNFQGGEYKKILMDKPYNRKYDEKTVGAVRVKNWEEVYIEIKRIEKEQLNES